MNNCIFTGHCINKICDQSCPDLVEATNLLDRNDISLNSKVFNTDPKLIAKYSQLLNSSKGKIVSIVTKDTVDAAELLTYCAICKLWRGSRVHVTVYNLKLSKYLEDIQNSWNAKSNNDLLEYQKIWASQAKTLIISNIDYVNFKEFQCQTLLSLIQSRRRPELTTIIVSPNPTSLIGSGNLFTSLTSMINDTKSKL